MHAVRALIVMAGVLLVAGIASAAVPQPSTIVRAPAPVEALAQDGGMLGWLAGDGKQCNVIHLRSGQTTYVLPQPPSGTMTCHWDLSMGAEHLSIAAGASAALWTLHERNADFVMTAQVGGKEIQVDRLAHANGTGSWLGGTTGAGTTLAYSSVDVEYVNPLGCGSGGSCKKRIRGGRIDVVTSGQKTPLTGAGAALGLSASNGRIAYIPATGVARDGVPVSSAGALVPVVNVSSGAVISHAKPVGVPLAVGLSSHALAILSRDAHALRLTWYDPATGRKLGGIGVPANTAPTIGVNDQFIAFRYGRTLRALALSTRHLHPLGKTAAVYLGLSFNQAGRLAWAENTSSSGVIRAVFVR